MTEERDRSELNIYGAEDFEELDSILGAIDRALAEDPRFTDDQPSQQTNWIREE